jgi:alkylation response protein AidB-like acyl-CoA dehydrogenase
VHFGLTAEQEARRAGLRALLAEVSPPSEVRRLMATPEGHDPALWRRLAAEPGLLDFAALGFVDLAVVLEEMGQVLLCAPYLATATAAQALLSSGEDDLLAGIAAGRTVATLAVAEATGRWEATAVTTRATPVPGRGWRLDGHKSYVVDGTVADVVLVAARSDAGVGLFAVPGDADGLTRTPLATVDQTRKQARLELAATPARRVAGADLDQVLQLAAAALAAEAVGGTQRCLDMAVGHARQRVQFGRPIGSFQAVKHLCADMLLDLETARSAAFYAAWAASERNPELPAAAAVAKARCCDAYAKAAADSLHVHGGLGFTWDHDAHLYFKRARSSSQLFGSPGHHRDLLAGHVGLSGP